MVARRTVSINSAQGELFSARPANASPASTDAPDADPVDCIPSFTTAPKPFVTAPFFAAIPQKPGTKRTVRVGDCDYEIGGPVVTSKKATYPALDVRHGELILGSMAFWQKEEKGNHIEFSLQDLFRRLNTSKGGAQSQRVLELFQDMAVTAIRKRTNITDTDDRRFPIVKEVAMRGEHISGIVLDERFCEIFADGAPVLDIRLDVLTGMSRSLAKALYLYMPSRAFYHSERNPFKRTLTNLLLETGCNAPKHKSARLQAFERRFDSRASVLDQLAGVETTSGRLRVDIKETEDGRDYNLLVWMDRIEAKPRRENQPTKLLQAWLKSGRSEVEFYNKGVSTLSDYDKEQLEACGIAYAPMERFLNRAKALIRPDTFESRIGDIKASVCGAGEPLTNPPGALIGALLAAVADGC